LHKNYECKPQAQNGVVVYKNLFQDLGEGAGGRQERMPSRLKDKEGADTKDNSAQVLQIEMGKKIGFHKVPLNGNL